jgi:hypothetical protein
MYTLMNRLLQTRWMAILLSVTLPIFLTQSLQAREMTENQVRAAVQTWVRSVPAQARPDAFIQRMEPFQTDGRTTAYIVRLTGGGFCLCGADDLVLPVYFYSPQGTYDPQHPDLQDILREINARTKYLHRGLAERDPEVLSHQRFLQNRAALWRDLIVGQVPQKQTGSDDVRDEPDWMILPLYSHWHQGSPYDDHCPELPPGEDDHCSVGCVATAISQIMFYWRWPRTGEGTGSTTYRYRWRTDWDEEPLANDPYIWGWEGLLEWDTTSGGTLRMNGYWDQTWYRYARYISEDSLFQIALANLPGQPL